MAAYSPPRYPTKKLLSYVGGKSKNKAPSKSNVRLDHFCGAPDREQRDMGKLLSIPYLTTLTYAAWNAEIINFIPKELGNPALDRRRPIALLEVFRKISLGAKKNQVFQIWEQNGLVQKDNYAFTRGKSISDAVLI